jgi:hypothetical protein
MEHVRTRALPPTIAPPLTMQFPLTFSLLHRFFETPVCFIKPEVRLDVNNRADLVVDKPTFSSSISWQHIVVYEGKDRGGNWPVVISQLHDYGNAAVTIGKSVYLAGAVGRQARFWTFKKGDSSDMRAIYVDRHDHVVIGADAETGRAPYNVAEDFKPLSLILHHLNQNHPPP